MANDLTNIGNQANNFLNQLVATCSQEDVKAIAKVVLAEQAKMALETQRALEQVTLMEATLNAASRGHHNAENNNVRVETSVTIRDGSISTSQNIRTKNSLGF